MSSLIHELQHAALDESSSVSSLLRKALLVASKLGVPDFEAWVRHELEGYGQTPVPGYRVITGAPKVFNPYRGYQDLSTDDPDLAEEISTLHLNTPMDALEDTRKASTGARWMSVYNPHVEKVLMDAMQIPLKSSLHIAESTVRGIMGRVRTIVLEWSMKLEKRGVIGEGMTFSEKERKEAATIHVETLIQGVSGSQIQVHSPGAQQHQGLSTQQLTDIKTLVELVSNIIGDRDKEERVRTHNGTSLRRAKYRPPSGCLNSESKNPGLISATWNSFTTRRSTGRMSSVKTRPGATGGAPTAGCGGKSVNVTLRLTPNSAMLSGNLTSRNRSSTSIVPSNGARPAFGYRGFNAAQRTGSLWLRYTLAYL